MKHQDPDPNKRSEISKPKFADADTTPRREGGDDALAETNPTDARADEKVIVNEQASNNIVNRPSQTELGRDADDIVNR